MGRQPDGTAGDDDDIDVNDHTGDNDDNYEYYDNDEYYDNNVNDY